MSQVYLRVCALVLTLAVCAAACGGDSNEAPVERSTSAGFTTYDVPSAGISIAVPEAWKTATADEAFEGADLEQIEEEDPEFAEIIRALAQPNSPMKFLALDPNATGGFATNANIIVEVVPDGFTREEYFDATLAQLNRLGNPQGLEQDRVELPAGEALHLVYQQKTPGQSTTNTTIQYVLFEGGTGYVLTYSVLPDRVEEYGETFDRSARSFRLL